MAITTIFITFAKLRALPRVPVHTLTVVVSYQIDTYDAGSTFLLVVKCCIHALIDVYKKYNRK